MRIWSVLIIALLFSVRAFADFYVSKSGSDSNPGTQSQPFLTIQKAADVMMAGDTCFIGEGVYHEMIVPANNGTSSAHLVFTNYQNEKVIIVGTDSVTGWTLYQNGIYKAYCPDTVYQVCVDKEMANEAQYPNFRGDRLSTNGWKAVTISTNGNAVYSGMNFPSGYWVGGYCVANVASKWITEIGKIDSSVGNMVHCTERSSPWSTNTTSYYIGSGTGYITHHLNALDTINEWHWQNDTLYYFPKDPIVAMSMNVQARTRMLGFDCTGKQYIDIINLNFVWASVSFEEAQGCMLSGCSVWYPAPFFYYSRAWDRQAHDNVNFGISHWAGKGVALSGSGNTVKDCYIAHSWGDGVSVGGLNNTVENCLVEDCDWAGTDCAVVTTVGSGHHVRYNTLRNSGRSTLVNRLSNQTDIMYNDMHDCGFLTHDLGITYSFHSNGGGSQIAYNLVHDNHSPTASMGVYLDNYDTAYIVHHNAIWNCGNAVQTNKPAVDHQIYNNTAWFCTNAMGAWGNTGTVIVNQVVRNNLSNKAWNLGTIFSNNLVTAAPQFTNPSSFDFTLTSSSPAIDYGTVIPGITDGYSGIAPDAGAFEYGVPAWIPGSDVQIPDVSEVLGDSSVTTSLNEVDFNKGNASMTVYPNPAIDEIKVKYDQLGKTVVALYNVHGEKLIENESDLELDLKDLESGLYILVLTNVSLNESISRIVVLQRTR